MTKRKAIPKELSTGRMIKLLLILWLCSSAAGVVAIGYQNAQKCIDTLDPKYTIGFNDRGEKVEKTPIFVWKGVICISKN